MKKENDNSKKTLSKNSDNQKNVQIERQVIMDGKDFSWLFEKNFKKTQSINPDEQLIYLNSAGRIIKSLGEVFVRELLSDIFVFLDTTVVIYEDRNEFSYSIFSSEVCKFLLDSFSHLKAEEENKILNKFCNYSCWDKVNKKIISTQKSSEIKCRDGMKIFAEPIFSQGLIIGSISFSYDRPVISEKEFMEASDSLNISKQILEEALISHRDSPIFLINYAKQKLKFVARAIGERLEEIENGNQLIRREEEFKELIDNSSLITYMFSRKTGVSFCSSKLKQILGINQEDLIKDPELWFRCIHSDDRKRVKEQIFSSDIKNGTELKYRIYDAKKRIRWFKEVIFNLKKYPDDVFYQGICTDITEQTEKQSRQRLTEKLINDSQSSIFWIKKNGSFFYINKTAAKSLNYTVDELVRLKVYEIDKLWTKDYWATGFEKIKTAGSLTFESVHIRKDGSDFPVEVISNCTVYDGEEMIYAFVHDISKRKKVEEKINESEYNMRFLAESAMELLELKTVAQSFSFLADKVFNLIGGDGIVVVSEYNESRENFVVKEVRGIKKFTGQLNSILGFNVKGMTGRVSADVTRKIKPGKLTVFIDDLEVLSGGKISKLAKSAIKKLFSIKDISTITLDYNEGNYGSISIIRFDKCKELNAFLIEGFVSQISIIIDRINALVALRNSEGKLSNLIRNLRGVVYRCINDSDWTMVFLNKEIENLTGYKAEELMFNNRISYNNIIHPDDRKLVADVINKFLKLDKQFTLEYRIIAKNGDVKWVWEKGMGVTSENGKYSHIEGFITDVTKIKENEQKVKDQLIKIRDINADLNVAVDKAKESDRLKSAFLANMSHEIRTPMNAILGFSEILSMKELEPEKKKRYIQNITNSGEQLLRLIDDIIDISKIESNQLKMEMNECNIDDCITELIENLENSKIRKVKKDLKIVYSPSQKHPNTVLKTDKIRFKQIIYNLISNSIKYSNKGIIEVGYNYLLDGDKEYIKFFIYDQGYGISKDNQEIIFQRFYQVEHDGVNEGTGLGLSITKALVEMLGGKIWFESEINVGSKFYFTLPYNSDFEINKIEKIMDVDFTDRFQNKSVCIAEDDISSFLLLEEFLEETGIVICHAENGKELLTLIDQVQPDIILLDINMPVLNGYKAIQEIRKKNINIPVIAQTAYAMQDERETIIAAGCNDYIAKPIARLDILRLMGKYI